MKWYLLYFLTSIFLLGCGKDNDDELPSPLDSVWSHKSHSCGFSPQTPLEDDAYTWSFNTRQNLLIVESSYEGDFICVPSPGKYSIVVENDKLIVESISYDYSVTSEELIVYYSPASDGPQFNFIGGE